MVHCRFHNHRYRTSPTPASGAPVPPPELPHGYAGSSPTVRICDRLRPVTIIPLTTPPAGRTVASRKKSVVQDGDIHQCEWYAPAMNATPAAERSYHYMPIPHVTPAGSSILSGVKRPDARTRRQHEDHRYIAGERSGIDYRQQQQCAACGDQPNPVTNRVWCDEHHNSTSRRWLPRKGERPPHVETAATAKPLAERQPAHQINAIS